MPADASRAFAVRRLTRADAPAYRAIRLEGLEINPEAFGASFEQEQAYTVEQVGAGLERDVVLGAFGADGEIAGVVGMFVRGAARLSHKAVLFGMFVRPSARRRGVAAALVEAILQRASETVEEIQLSVVASNDAAVALYTRAGFERFGFERRALKVGSEYYDEFLMAKRFSAKA